MPRKAAAPKPASPDPEAPPQLLVVGHAILDLLYKADAERIGELDMLPDDTLLVEDERQQAMLKKLGKPQSSACGGSAVNALITAVRLGARGSLICRVGDDDTGKRYLDELQVGGVQTHATVADGERSGQTLVLSDPPAHRSMATCLAASGGLSDLNFSPQMLDGVAWVLVEGYLLSGEESFGLALAVARGARERGLEVVLTLGAAAVVAANRGRFRELLEDGVDLLLGNTAEATALTSLEEPRASARQLAQKVPAGVVTDGERGAWGFTARGDLWREAAHKVKSVDALGAGDCFAGGFLASYMQDRDLSRALRLGCRAGAVGASHWGPRPPAKALDEIRQLWEPPPPEPPPEPEEQGLQGDGVPVAD